MNHQSTKEETRQATRQEEWKWDIPDFHNRESQNVYLIISDARLFRLFPHLKNCQADAPT